jgi:hypothetical protein
MRFARFVILLSFVTIGGLGLQKQALAYYCSEPSTPSCVSMLSISNDQFSFDLCRQQIKNYLAQVKVYQQCVINETNEEADKLIKKFNCHAQGNSMCF